MKAKVSIITLAVTDLIQSTAFYTALGFSLTQESQDSISFFSINNGESRLSLYPKQLLAQDIGIPENTISSTYTGITLAHNVASNEEVDACLLEAKKAGGTIIKPGKEVFWGGYSGYFSDLDGHIWEVAHNPFTDLT